jgi:two-component system OmpR family response regulator
LGAFDSGVALVADTDDHGCAAVCLLIGRLGLEPKAVRTGVELLDAAAKRAPALVVLDVELTEPTGFEVCLELRERYGDSLPIVFVGGSRAAPRDEVAGLLLGADDYFVKPVCADRFLARLRRLLSRAPTRSAPSRLTDRERDVLGLLVEGRRSAEVAEQLCITRKTASTHIEHILRKLGAHSQAQAVAIAVRERVIELRPAIPNAG